jgi:hypothetical protein
MKVRKIHSDKWFIHPDSEEINQDEWTDEAKAAYFSTSFELPPLIPGTDISKAQAVLIGSLTREQYAQQMSLQIQGGKQYNPLWYEHIIRHGVKDWRGFGSQDDNGNITECKPTFEDGPYGRRLTATSYNDLLFFYQSEMITIAFQIFLLS